MEGFLSGKGLKAPVFLDADGAFSQKYAVSNLPGLLVSKDGKAGYHGKLPDDADATISSDLRLSTLTRSPPPGYPVERIDGGRYRRAAVEAESAFV